MNVLNPVFLFAIGCCIFQSFSAMTQTAGVFPVDYVDQLNKKSLYPVNSEAILYMLKTKSTVWKYEKELRKCKGAGKISLITESDEEPVTFYPV